MSVVAERTKEEHIKYLLSKQFVVDRPSGQYTNSELVLILDEYGLEASYSGGGDSGGIDNIEFANESTNPLLEAEPEMPDSFYNQLEDMILDEIDYGGFAFEGGCDGTVSYNAIDKCIEISGTETDGDTYSIDGGTLDMSKLISPNVAALIDSININFRIDDEDGLDDEDDITVRINVRNGVYAPVFEEVTARIKARIQEIVDVALEKHLHDELFITVDEVVLPQDTLEIDVRTNMPDQDKGWAIELAGEDDEEDYDD